MQLFLDGGGMLLAHWKSLLCLFGAALGYGSLALSRFPGGTRDRSWIAFPFSLGAGAILLTCLSSILFLASLVWRGVLPFGADAILVAGGILLVWSLRRREAWASASASAGWGLLALLLLLTVRLAFVSKLVLPPYSDSPTHYLVVLNLLQPGSRPDALYSFGAIFQHYYHFGVHCLAAWLALVSGETSPLLLAVIGQVFLTIAPFSVFALAGILTENSGAGRGSSAAWAAGLIAAFGWWMPAYGVNWGKYPTVAGLAVLPIPLAYLYAAKGAKPSRAYFIVTGLLVAGTFLLHTRTSLVTGLALAAYFAARLWQRKLPGTSPASIAAGILLMAGLAFWAWLRPDLATFYTASWPLLIALAFLLVFAWSVYPLPTLATLLVLAGMGLLAGLPAPSSVQNISFQLLDRPFVQMGLYLPLSLLGGLGIAGLEAQLRRIGRISRLPVVLLSALVVIQISSVHPFHPDACCAYATPDDARALEWLKQHAAPQSAVVIAGLQTSRRIIETDAGIWVYALTGLHTTKRSFNSSLDDPAFLQSLCGGAKEVYLYVGGRPMSFRLPKSLMDSGDYRVAYLSGRTEVVQLQACLR